MELRQQAVLMRTVPRQRPARARAHAPARSRSSSTAACATSRPPTSRTWSRCFGSPTTRPTSSPGFACCSCSTGVGPATARRVARRAHAGAAADRARGAGRGPRAAARARPRARPTASSRRCERPRRRGAGRAAERLRDALAPLIAGPLPRRRAAAADLDQLVAAAREAPRPGALRRRAGARPAAVERGPGRTAAPRRGLPGASTIHSAKGLEWEAVHVLALYDGNFPACMAAGSSESDRRGAAPAVRRHDPRPARAAPVRPGALLPPARGRDDAHGYGKPSRFLTPTVRDTCEVTRLDDAPPAPARRGAAQDHRSVDALLR